MHERRQTYIEVCHSRTYYTKKYITIMVIEMQINVKAKIKEGGYRKTFAYMTNVE